MTIAILEEIKEVTMQVVITRVISSMYSAGNLLITLLGPDTFSGGVVMGRRLRRR